MLMTQKEKIPASLTGNASRYVLSNAREGIRSELARELIPEILSSFCGGSNAGCEGKQFILLYDGK